MAGCRPRPVSTLTVDIFGYNAVQIGLPQLDALAASRMPNKWLLDSRLPPPAPQESRTTLVAAFDELPFDSQSLDLVVLPHVLEFAAEPHQVLREVERVLIPEGRVIVCGFNPASLWGMRQGLGRITGRHYLPQAGELISMPHFGCYAPACRTEKWLRRHAFMDKAGARWWPYLGAVYIVQAIKRVKGMRLIGPAWTRKPATAPAGAPVEIYADGACKGNPGTGGWGALMVADGAKKEIYGGELNTTNNRMELKAVIEALTALKRPCQVVMYTDSQYVQKGISEWIHGWKARGWKTAAKAPVKNVDLWQALDTAQAVHEVEWRWVRGHNGHPGNERADQLANLGVETVRA
eukprot:gene22195-26634_t